MLTIKGTMINFIPQTTYTKEGETTPVKAKVQILTDTIRKDGTMVKNLQTISIPDTKISQYKDKISKEITVDVGLIAKEYSFYGI